MSDNNPQTETNLSLWKYFTDDAAKIKDRMWTIASWMFTLQAGLLGYSGKQFSVDMNNHLIIENQLITILASAIGIALSAYTAFMIQQYGQHIRGMWNRADMVRRQVPGLSEIWFLNNAGKIKVDLQKQDNEEQGLPNVAVRLIYFDFGFLASFIALLLMSVID